MTTSVLLGVLSGEFGGIGFSLLLIICWWNLCFFESKCPNGTYVFLIPNVQRATQGGLLMPIGQERCWRAWAQLMCLARCRRRSRSDGRAGCFQECCWFWCGRGSGAVFFSPPSFFCFLLSLQEAEQVVDDLHNWQRAWGVNQPHH